MTVGSYHYNQQFAELLHAQQIPIIWQLKPDIYAYPAGGMARFAQMSQVILMNHLEADYVLNALGMQSPADLINGATQVAVLTRGAEGISIYSQAGEQFVPAKATHIIDTTGAGDGFTAGFIAGLLRGHNLPDCARLGVVLASFVLEKIGCQTNLPNTTQVDTRFKEFFGE